MKRYLLPLLIVAMLVITACAPITAPAAVMMQAAAGEETAESVLLKFDVAEDMARFAFDQTKTFDDGLPAHGASFVTQGYIYEYGTLDGTNGTHPDGSPEFPDKVIGEWVCRGWFVGDAAHATTGPWVITTQLYMFDEEHGGGQLVTDGYELSDIDLVGLRAVTGGTGEYAEARGEAMQTLLGFNSSEGVNLRFEIEVQQ
ncbi:MAG: hypothetical protein HC802_15660 [Caldilineaceae bacterium]|nr:hypothetical protein [Caldilineaceae bacterium]